MRRHPSLFRLTAAMAIGGLMLGPCAAPLAQAQDAQAPAPGGDQAAAAAAPIDPPARVGRVSALTGTVSFRTTDSTEWQFATLNYPVTSGNDFWTQPNANLALGLGGVKLVLDQQTEADIESLTDTQLSVTEPQGAIYLNVRQLPAGSTAAVTTPRAVVSITAPGRYEIVAGDAEQPTRVEVIDGAASIAIGNVTLQVAPQQAATVTGSDQASFQGSVGAAVNDPFITAELAKEQAPPPVATVTGPAYTPPPLVQDMTGYESLAQVGEWQPSPQYGEVWYPPVQANYVPYRDGHWAFVAPWGWTWVDNAPWGFAPFHYGRWSRFGDRWGWVPYERGEEFHPDARPVYAPALVAFVGFGVGVAVGAALAGGGRDHHDFGGSVGWVPLGPHEAYHPAFQASPSYVRNVNINHVTNVSVINNTTTINNYANASAATVVPAATMTGSRPVAAAVQRITPQQLAAARPVAQAPVRPTFATVGVTPAVARQYNIARPAGGAARPASAARPAPGPAITPAVIRPAGATAARPALPALARPTAAAATHALPAAATAGRPAEAARPAERPPVPGAPPAPPAKAGERPAAAAPVPPAKPGERPAVAAPAPAAKPAEHPAAAAAPAPAPHPLALPAARPATPSAAARPEIKAAPAPTPAERPAARPVPAAAAPKEAPAAPRPAAVAPRPAPAVVEPRAAARPQPAPEPRPQPAARPAERPAPAPAPRPAARAPEKPAEKKCPPNQKAC